MKKQDENKIDDGKTTNTPDQLDAYYAPIPGKEMRTFIINGTQQKKFVNNSIKTAKYNAFTFLPLAIIYQFNNYFNIFFLISAVISSITLISPLDPATALGPFLFVIIVSLIREAIEDYKKTKYDKLYNNSPTYRWNSTDQTFLKIKWADVQVGDVIKITKNEIIPCDVLVIKSSMENGFCYLETTNLDGESALKPRESLVVVSTLILNESDLNYVRGSVEVDLPNNDIYKLEGTLFLEGYERSMFNINNVLLRGGRLKNVDYVYGIVLYTGKDTKIMKNIKHGSLKLSSIDVQLNTIVIFIMIIVLFMCAICTIFGGFFRSDNLPDYANNLLNADYILYYNKRKLGETKNDILEIIRIFASLFIIFSTLIPISLMISYQVVKGMQILIIEKDPLLAEDPVNDKMKALTFSLHEDLGMVKYIFTDKTGTLTRNEMEFYACSIFTKSFDNEDEEEEEKDNRLFNNPDNKTAGVNTNSQSRTLAFNFNKDPMVNKSTSNHGGSLKLIKSSIASCLDKSKLIDCLTSDTLINIQDVNECPFKSYREATLEFFLNIALNHNVLTEIDPNTGEKHYQGSNPDEVTLVTSACELGIEFLEREANTIRVKILDKIEKFEVIQKFEFSSARMRSSIIVRDSNGNHKLYMKGADTKIFEKINQFSKQNILEKSKTHLDSFAKRGLRTLCYSFKNLNEDHLYEWNSTYKSLKYQAINNKSLESEVEKHISKIEVDFTLLGVSALEDKLQDGVKNDLQNFIEAGINVWMITGDKMDTAESIGYSCRLFNNDTEVFKIKKSENLVNTKKRMEEIMKKMIQLQQELEEFKTKKNEEDEPSLINKGKISQKNTENLSQRKNMETDEINLLKSSKGINTTLNFNNGFSQNIEKKIIETDKYPNFDKKQIEINVNVNKVDIEIGKLVDEKKQYQTEKQNSTLHEEKLHASEIKSNEYQSVPIHNKSDPRSSPNKKHNIEPLNKEINIISSIEMMQNVAESKRGNQVAEIFQNPLPDQVNYVTSHTININKSPKNEKQILLNKNIIINNSTNNNVANGVDNISNATLNHLKRMGIQKRMQRANSNTRTFLRKRFSSLNSPDVYFLGKDIDEISKKNIQDIDDQTIMNFIIDKNLENSSLNDGNNFTLLNNLPYRNQNTDLSMMNPNAGIINDQIVKYDEENDMGIIESDDNNDYNGIDIGSIRNADEIIYANMEDINKSSNHEEIKEGPYDFKNKNLVKSFHFPKLKNDDEQILIGDVTMNLKNKNLSHHAITIKEFFDNPIPTKRSENSTLRKNKRLKIEIPKNKNYQDERLCKTFDIKKVKTKPNISSMPKNFTEANSKNFFGLDPFDPDLYKKKGTNFKNVMNYLENQIEKIDNRNKSLIPIFKKKKALRSNEEEQDTRNILINFGLIIEGEAIDHCLSPETGDLFWNLMKKCRSIIACRCSPLQKAMIVSYVKKRSNRVTLAIGDGGNDLNMIKTANIGIGIFGKEGYQAAYSSDFAISQFKYLKRLLFNNGRFALERNSYFVYFFFFKNIIFSLPQFWLCFFSGFSGLNYYDQWFYLGFNSFMTTFPIGARSLVEEDIDIETKKQPERQIIRTFMPDIYNEFRESNPFNVAKFFMVFISAFVYSCIIYFVPFFNFKYNIQDSSGRSFSMWDFSLASFFSIIAIHFCILFEDSYLNTWFNIGVYMLQSLIIIAFVFIHNMRNAGEISGIMFDITNNINFWLTFFLTTAVCLVPFYIIRRVEFFSADNIINNLKKKNYEDDYKKKYLVKGLEGMSKNLRYVVKFKKILQGHEVEDDNYANKRVKQLVELFQSTRKSKKDKKKKVNVKKVEHEEIHQPKRSMSFNETKYNYEVILKKAKDQQKEIPNSPSKNRIAIESRRNSNISNKKYKNEDINRNYDSNVRDR